MFARFKLFWLSRNIHGRLCVVLSIFLFVVSSLILFVVLDKRFRSESADGYVESVMPSLEMCGRGLKRKVCTKFEASVSYLEGKHCLRVYAGVQDFANATIESASLKVGGIVKIRYLKAQPSYAWKDSVGASFGVPLIVLLIGIFFAYTSQKEKRLSFEK